MDNRWNSSEVLISCGEDEWSVVIKGEKGESLFSGSELTRNVLLDWISGEQEHHALENPGPGGFPGFGSRHLVGYKR
jgi:hypothetical protein